MYECKACKYITTRSTDFHRHEETKKHKSAIIRKNDISKKRQINKNIDNNISPNINENINEIFTKITNIQKSQQKIQITQKNTTKELKKITNYINFLNTYCKNLQPITKLSESEVDIILDLEKYDKFEFSEMILEHIKSKQLHIKIGDLLLKKFLKQKNILKQQIWTSDVSRLIYLIFKITDENKKSWVRDKKGELFTEMVSVPILNRIEKILRKYTKHVLNKIDIKNIDSKENITNLNNVQLLENFFDCVNLDKIKIELLKHIANKLSISIHESDLLQHFC